MEWNEHINEGRLDTFFYIYWIIQSHILFIYLFFRFTQNQPFLVIALSFHFFLEMKGITIINWKKYQSKTLLKVYMVKNNFFLSRIIQYIAFIFILLYFIRLYFFIFNIWLHYCHSHFDKFLQTNTKPFSQTKWLC